MTDSTIKKSCVIVGLLLAGFVNGIAQYQITGFNPVIDGVNYGPYTITGGTWSATDHWCVTNGTLNNTSNTCMSNQGTPSISVTWTGSGTLSYYTAASGSTPVATYSVTAYFITNSIQTNPNAEFFPDFYPFVPLNQLYTLNLTGTDVIIPGATINFWYEESADGTNYTQIPNSSTRDFSLSQTFTQNTWIRRGVTVNVLGIVYTSYSSAVTVTPATAVQAGAISPLTNIVSSGGNPGTFTVSPASGGSMCGGSYTYTWQTSPDNMTWTNAGSGLTFSPGTITANKYIRVLAYCGPVAGVSSTALAGVISYPGLQAGTISPMTTTISSGASPGNLTGNPASGGNSAAGYTYLWYYSTNGGSTWQTLSPAVSTLNYNPGNMTTSTWYKRQVTNNGNTAFSNVVKVNIGSAEVTQNYIRTRLITAANISSTAVADGLIALGDVKQTTAYFDDLGRPVQTVAKQASLVTNPTPAPTDMVIPVQYDPAGRQVFDYLPYASTANDGNYKPNALPEQNAFNVTAFQAQGDHFYYSQSNFEPSPLNRINNVSAAGDNWTGSNRAIQSQYLGNSVSDQVIEWTVNNSGTTGTFGAYVAIGYYPVGALYKLITVDESGKQTIEFKDKNGNLILKKAQFTASADDGVLSGGHSGWLCTYYIYDLLNNLRCVVQPHGVELLIQNGWLMSALGGDILNQQCFRYEYDQRNRVIMKQVPGAGAIYMVYDNLDRLVMTQDANMRPSNQWMTTLYENALDRPVATGLYTTTTSFATLLAAAASSSSYPFVVTSTPTYPTWELLTLTHYDDYTGLPAGLGATLNTAAITMSNFYSSYSVPPLYAQQMTQSTPSTAVTTKGFITWTQAEVLDGTHSVFISTASIYDTRGRVLQQQTVNYSGGLDISLTQYDFSGKPLISALRHQKLSAGNPTQTYELATRNSYDDLGRSIKLEKELITALVPVPAWKTISTMAYDALGRLTTKAVGNNPNLPGHALENMVYEYNVRGWLLGVNRNFINSSSPTNYFGFELGYDKAAAIVPGSTYPTQQYTGNIEGTIWKNGGDGAVRKYDYSYDAVNRLTHAEFYQYNSSFNKNDGLDFTVNIPNYDVNGNIINMSQMGWKGAGSSMIDNLTYTLVPNSNRLQNVMDNTYNDPNTTLGDFRYSPLYTATLPSGQKATTTIDYGYDNNGNLTSDKNKDITSITYNYLNLPQTITVSGQTVHGTITYVYDAMGNKLSKKVFENPGIAFGTSTNITTTTSYVGGFVYETKVYSATSLAAMQYTDNLQYFGHEEGRVRGLYTNAAAPYALNGFAFDYLLKDHLGDTRVVVTEEQETDPYPTLTFEGSTPSDVANQNAIWDNHSGTAIDVLNNRATLPVGFSSSTNGSYAGSITKSGGAIGAAKLLKVMAGDQLNVSIDYTYSGSIDNGSASGINTLTGSLVGIMSALNTPVTAALKGQASTIASNLGGNSAVQNFFSPESVNHTTSAPEAYLHILLFNNQFVFDNVNSVVIPISSTGLNTRQTITMVASILKSGYAFIYFSNESNTIVYFDNFALTYIRGPLVETNDYYPFGLTMTGISDKALKSNYIQNKHRYNGKELQNQEFSDGSGLEEYDYGARYFDPQLGIWHNLDPLAEKTNSLSPYNYALNSPVRFVDPSGTEALGADGLTTAQWIEASRPGADPNLANQYRQENRDAEQSEKQNSSTGNVPDDIVINAKSRDGNGNVHTKEILRVKTNLVDKTYNLDANVPENLPELVIDIRKLEHIIAQVPAWELLAGIDGAFGIGFGGSLSMVFINKGTDRGLFFYRTFDINAGLAAGGGILGGPITFNYESKERLTRSTFEGWTTNWTAGSGAFTFMWSRGYTDAKRHVPFFTNATTLYTAYLGGGAIPFVSNIKVGGTLTYSNSVIINGWSIPFH